MDIDRMRRLANELVNTANEQLTYCEYVKDKLCEALHGLLGPFDGRDPGIDGPIDLETNGIVIQKAQAVLAEVE